MSYHVNGDISIDELLDAIRSKFPEKNVVIGDFNITSSNQVSITNFLDENSELDFLKSQLKFKEKELQVSETNCSKALISIQTFHKQQQDLFDEFVLLRQKYDEQKNTLMSVLWNNCSQHHPELRHIPPMEDPEKFEETEEIIGKYHVGTMLGEGQFASVRECCKLDEEDVHLALKIIKKERIMNFQSLKRMSNEIETLRKLKSKYIVILHDVFQTSNFLYIVTEKGGPDLFEFFDEHPDGVPEAWAKEIMYKIIRAVEFCHDHRYCHRDLKPEVNNFNQTIDLICYLTTI